jgi:hypothetical protein
MASTEPVVLVDRFGNPLSVTGGTLDVKPVPFRGTVSTIMSAQVFDDNPTSAASSSIDTDQYGWVNVHLNVDSTNAPTRIQFIPQFSNDAGTTWIDYDQDFYQAIHFEDTEVATAVNKGYQLPVFGDDFRINVVATGTDATNTFTVTIKVQPQSIR